MYKPGDMVLYMGHRRTVLLVSGQYVVLKGSPPVTAPAEDVERWEPPLMPGPQPDPVQAPFVAPADRRVKAAKSRR